MLTTTVPPLTLVDPSKPKVEICFGGVRPLGPENQFTTSYGIYIPGDTKRKSTGIIVDNGTGIYNVNNFLTDKKPVTTIQLQTHLHKDHTIGLPFNKKLLEGRIDFMLMSDEMFEGLSSQFSRPNWSINPLLQFKGIRDSSYIHTGGGSNGVQIQYMDLPHGEDGSRGFQIVVMEKVIHIATDCELGTAEDLEKFAMWTKHSDCLVIDMQYNDQEYFNKKGWGHNSVSLVIEMLTRRVKMRYKDISHLILVHRENNVVNDLDNRSAIDRGKQKRLDLGFDKIHFPKDGQIINI